MSSFENKEEQREGEEKEEKEGEGEWIEVDSKKKNKQQEKKQENNNNNNNNKQVNSFNNSNNLSYQRRGDRDRGDRRGRGYNNSSSSLSSSYYSSNSKSNSKSSNTTSFQSSNLTIENLSKLQTKKTGNPFFDDTFSTTGRSEAIESSIASSLATFDLSRHATERMNQREISLREISRVIKHGVVESNNRSNCILVALDDIVVVLTITQNDWLNNVRRQQTTSIQNISDMININETLSSEGGSWRKGKNVPDTKSTSSSNSNLSSSKQVITVYRTPYFVAGLNPRSGLSPKEFATWLKFNLHISSTMSGIEPSPEIFENMLIDAQLFHGNNILKKILDWRINPNYRIPRDLEMFQQSYQITLLSKACTYGYPNLVKLLMNYGASAMVESTAKKNEFPPLHCLLSSDRLTYAPWCTSEKDVEIIKTILNQEYTTPEQQLECITKRYGYTLLKKAVFSTNQSIVNCLLETGNYGNLSDHDDKNETIEESAKYGGVNLTLDQEHFEKFFPVTQLCPEGFSVLNIQQIPHKFKLRIVGEEFSLGYTNSQLKEVSITNHTNDPKWSEIIFSVDQPINMWGLERSVEDQWFRIYDSEVENGEILRSLKHLKPRNVNGGEVIKQTLGYWSPATNTINGNKTIFRMYVSNSSPNSNIQQVIIGASCNSKEDPEEFLERGYFLTYIDNRLTSSRLISAESATVFEIIPFEEV